MKKFLMVLPLAMSLSAFAQGEKGADKKCDKFYEQTKKQADNCVKNKNVQKRKVCFEKIGNNVRNFLSKLNDGGACGAKIETIKEEFMSKEASMYPGQQNPADGGPQAGMPNGDKPNMPEAPKKPVVDCPKAVDKIKKAAEACLKIKAFEKRNACMDKVGEHAFSLREQCGEQVDQLKNNVEQKEKELYPNQKSTVDGGNQGPQHQGPQGGPQGGPQMNGDHKGPHSHEMGGDMKKPAVDCPKVVEKLKKAAETCLKMKARDKRNACMDKVGEQVGPAQEMCPEPMNQLKQFIMEKEKEMYPDQEPTVK